MPRAKILLETLFCVSMENDIHIKVINCILPLESILNFCNFSNKTNFLTQETEMSDYTRMDRTSRTIHHKIDYDNRKIIDKWNFLQRKILESWQTANATNAVNNANTLPEHYSILLKKQ